MLAYVFVLAVIAARLLLRPLAFAPVGAALLFFGARAPRKLLWVPLALLTVTDLYLTLAVYGQGLKADQIVTSAWYLAVLLLGSAFLKRAVKPVRVLVSALGASVSFFVLSNFTVWAVWPTYPKTLSGLAACYVAAIPFFRNQVASDVFFTAVMFAIPMAIEALRSGESHDHIRAA